MSKKTVHVTPNSKQGGWNVKKGGAQRASVHADTKTDAIRMGRIMSQRSGSELIIHSKDGKIQRTDSHGNDHCPPKDKK